MSDTMIIIMFSMLMIIMVSIIIILAQVSMLLMAMLNRKGEVTTSKANHESYGPVFNAQEIKPKKVEALKVPDLDPLTLAPGLKNPPKAAGGFGTKTEKNDP